MRGGGAVSNAPSADLTIPPVSHPYSPPTHQLTGAKAVDVHQLIRGAETGDVDLLTSLIELGGADIVNGKDKVRCAGRRE